jgi:hypothetical protein
LDLNVEENGLGENYTIVFKKVSPKLDYRSHLEHQGDTFFEFTKFVSKNIGSHELDLRMLSVKRLSCQVCCCASCTHTYWLLSKNYNLINFIMKLGLFFK